MIKVNKMKPFYARKKGEVLTLVFAYQYFSIIRDDENWHFIPIEGKEIIIDIKTREIKNLSEVFVFQQGNRFLRFPLREIILIDGVSEKIEAMVLESTGGDGYVHLNKNETIKGKHEVEVKRNISDKQMKYIEDTLADLELTHVRNMIDKALDEKNEEDFRYYSRILSLEMKKIEEKQK